MTSGVMDTPAPVGEGGAMTTTASAAPTAGELLRTWRQRRRRSQLDLATAADVSTRHLSFVETGRSIPSRTMIQRLCDELDVPLRDRNDVYLAAGLAPVHRRRPLAELGPVLDAVDAVLLGHEPNPAVAVDSRWDMLGSNRAMDRFLADLPPMLAEPPLNMLRVTLHPDGLARAVLNGPQWRAHVLRRVRRQLDRTADPGLADLLAELSGYPVQPGEDAPSPAGDVVAPLLLATPAGTLALLYTVTVFGSPRDVTVDEIAVETFFPADDATRALLQGMAG